MEEPNGFQNAILRKQNSSAINIQEFDNDLIDKRTNSLTPPLHEESSFTITLSDSYKGSRIFENEDESPRDYPARTRNNSFGIFSDEKIDLEGGYFPDGPESSDSEKDDDSDKELEFVESKSESYEFDIVTEFESRMGLEIILYIFSYLSLTDIHNISTVCKSFRNYAMHPQLHQWKHLHLFPYRRKITDKLLYRITKHCSCIKMLDIKYCKYLKSTKCLDKMLENGTLNSLEVLDLSGTVFREDQLLEFSKKLLSKCQHLTSIDFSWTKLNKAVTIQNLLQYESTRQESSSNKRKNQLVLKFSSSLHIRSGEKLLKNMNIKVEFIEKRDNTTKLKLSLLPYKEDVQTEEMPKLPISGSLRAKAAIPLWKVGTFVYTTLKLGDKEVDDIFPEDYIELYYGNTLLHNIYSMSLSNILDSFVFTRSHKPIEGITLYFRHISCAKKKERVLKSVRDSDRAGSFCPVCLVSISVQQLNQHMIKCGLVHIQKALDLPEGIHHLRVDDAHPWKSQKKKKTQSVRLGEHFKSDISLMSSMEYVDDETDEVLCWTHGDTVALVPEQPSSALAVRGVITCHDVNKAKGIVLGFREGDILYVSQLQKSKREALEFNRFGSVNENAVSSIFWLPNSSTTFIAAFSDGNMYIFDITKPSAPKPPKQFTEAKKSLGPAIAHNKKDTNPIAMWHVVNSAAITAIKFSPISSLLAVIYNNCITIFDVFTEKFVFHYQEKEIANLKLRSFNSIDWSFDQKYIVVGGYGGVSLWEFGHKKCLDLGSVNHQVSNIKFDNYKTNSKTYRFGCVTDAGLFGVWEFEASDPKLQLLLAIDLSMRLTSLLFTSTSIAISGFGGRLRIWNRPKALSKATVYGVASLKTFCLKVVNQCIGNVDFKKVKLSAELAKDILKNTAAHLLDSQSHREIARDNIERTEKKCKICSNSFGVFRHRHICKVCYNMVCGSCSKHFELGNIPGNVSSAINVCLRCNPLLIAASVAK